MAVLANIFSLSGGILLILSTFAKSKQKILGIQVANAILCALGNFLVCSYSGTTTNLIAAIRNTINAFDKNNKIINTALVLSVIIIGILFNTRGIVGFLPIIASASYTILLAIVKSAQGIRYALLLNIVIWLTHDIIVGLYAAIITDIIMLSMNTFNIVRLRSKGER